MILYAVCWQDLCEPWGWEPLCISGGDWAFLGVPTPPMRRTLAAAAGDFVRLRNALDEPAMDEERGILQGHGGYFAIRQFELEE